VREAARWQTVAVLLPRGGLQALFLQLCPINNAHDIALLLRLLRTIRRLLCTPALAAQYAVAGGMRADQWRAAARLLVCRPPPSGQVDGRQLCVGSLCWRAACVLTGGCAG
jgi:hypothetical protein